MLIRLIHTFFVIFEIMIFARIIGSWIPQLQRSPLLRFVAYYTDPYLNIFRRIIPPIGGAIDISPFLAFLALGWIEKLIYWILFSI
jgi:YggT family protein